MRQLKSLKDIWNKYMYILTTSQKKWGVVVIIMTVIGAMCETLGVSIILPLVQVMIEPQQLRDNRIIMPVIDFLHLDSDASLIWGVGILVIFVYLGKNLFLVFLSWIRVKYACKVQRELSTEMMESYMKRGYVFFLNTSTAELLRGMRDGIMNTYLAMYQIFKLFAEALTITFICVYIVCTDVLMAICVVALAIICLLMVVFVCQKKMKKYGELYYECFASINKMLLQTFQGIKEVLVMNRQKYFVETYESEYIKQQKGTVGQTVMSESPAYLIEATCVTGLIIAVCLKTIGASGASVMVPQLASFAVAAFRILPSLGRISNNFNQFMFNVPGVNDTYENFKEVRQLEKQAAAEEAAGSSNMRKNPEGFTMLSGVDKPAGAANAAADQKTEIAGQKTYGTRHRAFDATFTSTLSVSHVTWKYPNAEDNVLRDISIDIPRGSSVAFVGKSGAGKTTLADVILGLLTPQSGRVCIDGVDIREMMEGENRLIGFVPQGVNLLDDTVRRNVAFGIPDEEIDDAAVWSALEQAQMKEIIKELPAGLDTEIGERGVRFSGGQRQRFAIARALYNNPDILILDEATSALDTETETAVMESIEALQWHKTLIIIAHRLTTIRGCDVIYEIGDGKATVRRYEELI